MCFSQFTEQEKKLMEATTEFQQKVNAFLKISQFRDWLLKTSLTGCFCPLLGLHNDITRKLTWNITIWRSARRWTSRWPPSKQSWSPSNWRQFGTSQVNVQSNLMDSIDRWELVKRLSPDDFCSTATVFSCLAIALGVYRFWR